MKKLIGHVLLVFAVLYPSSAFTNTPDGKAVLCSEEAGLRGYHFYDGRVVTFDDSMNGQPIFKRDFIQTHDFIRWTGPGLKSKALNRKTLELKTGVTELVQCKLLPLKEIKSRLADSKKRKLIGNKL